MRIPRVREMKESGEWANRYISAPGLVPVIKELGECIVGLEIGVAAGENIVYLLDNCPNIGIIVGIDPWLPYTDVNGAGTEEVVEASYEVAMDNFSDYGDRVIIFRETSDQAVERFKTASGSYDYIFIDGNHDYEYVLNDLKNYYHLVRKGGLVTGHDAGLHTVQRALKEFIDSLPYRPEVKPAANGAWYFVKE